MTRNTNDPFPDTAHPSIRFHAINLAYGGCEENPDYVPPETEDF